MMSGSEKSRVRDGENRARLRAAGLRSTAARIAVMRILQAATKPLTHAEIAAHLVPLGFDKATAYRNLMDLTQASLVSRSELGDHVWRFELRGEGQAHDAEHPHFLCVDCGKVSCLPQVSVNITSRLHGKKAPFVDVTEVLLKGHCTQCR